MSRSFKKNPVCTDYSRNRTKFYKRLANKKVRKYQNMIGDGSSYKKIFNSWTIRDYKIIHFESDFEYFTIREFYKFFGK